MVDKKKERKLLEFWTNALLLVRDAMIIGRDIFYLSWYDQLLGKDSNILIRLFDLVRWIILSKHLVLSHFICIFFH